MRVQKKPKSKNARTIRRQQMRETGKNPQTMLYDPVVVKSPAARTKNRDDGTGPPMTHPCQTWVLLRVEAKW